MRCPGSTPYRCLLISLSCKLVTTSYIALIIDRFYQYLQKSSILACDTKRSLPPARHLSACLYIQKETCYSLNYIRLLLSVEPTKFYKSCWLFLLAAPLLKRTAYARRARSHSPRSLDSCTKNGNNDSRDSSPFVTFL
jgi:hypothetical protein